MDPRSSIPPHYQQPANLAMGQSTQSTQSLPPSVQCSPIFVEYQLMKEFVLFQKQNLAHVYVVPSQTSAFDWFGVMFIHSGIYCGKILRFTVFVSPAYPNCDVPKIVFDPIPIHPLVNQNTGELDISLHFTKWNSTNNFVFEIIEYAKAVFEIDDINDLVKHTNNQMNSPSYDTDGLKKLVSERMNAFNEEVVNKNGDDKHFINFSEPENSTVIDKLRSKLLTDKVSLEDSQFEQFAKSTAYKGAGHSPTISGLSWAKNIIFK